MSFLNGEHGRELKNGHGEVPFGILVGIDLDVHGGR